MPLASDLTAHTGYWLRMVSNAVSQDFARKVADEGVTVAEWSFMRALYDAEHTPARSLRLLQDTYAELLEAGRP